MHSAGLEDHFGKDEDQNQVSASTRVNMSIIPSGFMIVLIIKSIEGVRGLAFCPAVVHNGFKSKNGCDSPA